MNQARSNVSSSSLHRYSDFIVHELAKDGGVVKLSSYSLPIENAEVSIFYTVL